MEIESVAMKNDWRGLRVGECMIENDEMFYSGVQWKLFNPNHPKVLFKIPLSNKSSQNPWFLAKVIIFPWTSKA